MGTMIMMGKEIYKVQYKDMNEICGRQIIMWKCLLDCELVCESFV